MSGCEFVEIKEELSNFNSSLTWFLMEYKYGSLVNNYKSFFYNGTVEEEMYFLDGEYHGAKKMYFLNGKLKEETTYVYGEKHGKKTTYYENGNKKEEKMFSNDIEHGMSFFYDKVGKLKKKKDYFNGKIYTIENL